MKRIGARGVVGGLLAVVAVALAGCGGDSAPAGPQLSLVAGSTNGPGNLDGVGPEAAFYWPAGAATDRAGNIYIGDTQNFTIRKITPAGVVTTFAGTQNLAGTADGTGSAALFCSPGALAVDSAGNVYVADSCAQTIRKITPAGVVSTLAGSPYVRGHADGTGSAASFYFPEGIAVDGAGNVYVADATNSTIRKITPAGVVSTLAGTAGVLGSADGTGAAASFHNPYGVASDSAGNLYVADTLNDTIRAITPAGVVTTLAGTALAFGRTDGTGAAARFFDPVGISIDSAGNLYVADTNNQTIRKITPGAVVTTLAGSGAIGSADGAGTAANFAFPAAAAVDGTGNVYVADTENDTVRKITPAGVVTTFAGIARIIEGHTDGTGAQASFAGPGWLAADSAGNLYTAGGYHTVRKITPQGVVTTFAGATAVLGTSTDGTGPTASFVGPMGLAIDSAGNIYATDDCTIRKITPAGVVTTIAGTPAISGHADGTGPAASFNNPLGIAVDGAGNLYVVDSWNGVIRKITPAGVVSTLAGTAGVLGYADGAGPAAKFFYPIGVAVDHAGNLYVTDNNTIRKITPAGVVTTLAGTAWTNGSADGVGTAARFNGIADIAISNKGNLYVVDTWNSTIRKVTPAGVVTTVIGTPGVNAYTPGSLPGTLPYPNGIAVYGSTLYVTAAHAVLQVSNVP